MRNPGGKLSGLSGLPRRILAGLGALLLGAGFYLLMVVGAPDSSGNTESTTQPLLSASGSVMLEKLSDLDGLVSDFPVPVLLASGSTLSLQSGGSYDAAFENGYGRVLTLNYATESSEQVQISSIYPARALSLMDAVSYRLKGTGGNIAGKQAIRMESDTHIRLHLQTGTGLYVITFPKEMADEDITAVTNCLRLSSR